MADLNPPAPRGSSRILDPTRYATRTYVDAAVSAFQEPDLSGLASTIYVDNAIAGIDVPSLDGYATETYVDSAIAAAPAADGTGKVTGLNGVTGLWSGYQAEYDALTPDPSVVYIIVEGEPAPVAVPVAVDSFERTVASGWGTADTGGAWTNTSNNNSIVSVAGGRGIVNAKGGESSTIVLQSVSIADVTVAGTFTAELSPAEAGAHMTLIARRVGGNDYRFLTWLRDDGSVWLMIQRRSPGETNLQVLSGLSFTWKSGDIIRTKLEVSGTSPVQLRGKAWLSTAVEPATWTIEHSDAAAERLSAAGSVGVKLLRPGTSTDPRVLAVDDFRADPLGA